MKARVKKHILDFKRPSGTSRGVLTKKETWFLILESQGKFGIGECGMFKGLSYDDVPEYEEKLNWVCNAIENGRTDLWSELSDFPSILFGLEQALLSIKSDDPFILFKSDFTQKNTPIPINGLVWMGDKEFMLEQIREKLDAGFSCIKMKIGAIDFNTELSLLTYIRENFSADDIELRVDANGAFKPEEAFEKLTALSTFELHSIEQPIKQGNINKMGELCSQSPLPIALDEELIGVHNVTDKKELLQTIKPQYIILKPTLAGGFRGSREWIDIADSLDIGWWITSALESNIGLNAIAQWTYIVNNDMPQGLGTGSLFTNNFDCPLKVKKGALYYDNNANWKTNLIENLCL